LSGWQDLPISKLTPELKRTKMRLTPIAAALALSLTAAALAQDGAAPAGPTFSADRFKAHVAFLSDDRLEGRDTGSRGHEIAAAYVASQFLALGLKPGGENGGWYQQVPLRSAVLASKPVVTVIGPRGEQSWENGSEILVRPSQIAEQIDLTAPAVFAGYGIDAPDQGIDDYKGLDVRGKIVVVLSGTPSDIPSEIGAYLGDRKSAMAARHGAAGVVQVYTDAAARVQPWASVKPYAGRPSLDWLQPDGQPIDEAPGVRAGGLLNDPVAEALFAGARRSYAAVRTEAARAGAHPKGFPLATRLRIQVASRWSQVSSPEVIGLLPGSDPALKDEYVVLMGHLDHLGIKPNATPGEDAIYNGALDNAAGVATMLEAARAFTESGERPRRSILFIANTGEEKGLLGADFFAHHPTVPIGKIAGVVDLDMPLLLYDFTDVVAFGAEHSQVAEAVARAAAKMNVALAPDPMPDEHIFVRSDHYEFVRQGVPAILLATGFANGGGAKWQSFLSGTYHRVNDDMSQPINWAAGARYARLNYLISRELADSDRRPLWYEGDYFGNLFAPGAPRAARPAAPRG
jgi:Zn-dependent M28 family amino/carboxypeptidase